MSLYKKFNVTSWESKKYISHQLYEGPCSSENLSCYWLPFPSSTSLLS